MEPKKEILEFIKIRERESINDSYFEDLAMKAILTAKQQNLKIKRPLLQRSIFWVSSAAAVILVVIVMRYNNQSLPIGYDENTISNSELISYIDNNIEEFDEDLFAHYLANGPSESEQPEVSIQEEMKKKSSREENESEEKNENIFENIDSEDVLKYLEKEGISVEELEESQNI